MEYVLNLLWSFIAHVGEIFLFDLNVCSAQRVQPFKQLNKCFVSHGKKQGIKPLYSFVNKDHTEKLTNDLIEF